MRIEMRKMGKGRFTAWGKPTRAGEKRIILAMDEPLETLKLHLRAQKAALESARGRTAPS